MAKIYPEDSLICCRSFDRKMGPLGGSRFFVTKIILGLHLCLPFSVAATAAAAAVAVVVVVAAAVVVVVVVFVM